MRKHLLYYIFLTLTPIQVFGNKIFAINEDYVCAVKSSCGECVWLNHCAWCAEKNLCFSTQLQNEDFCPKNGTVEYEDLGLTLQENAQCVCDASSMEQQCRPPGSTDEVPECSGRGRCRCGRCACDDPDPQLEAKEIMGEFCELDNFSCIGADCDEGPYNILQSI